MAQLKNQTFEKVKACLTALKKNDIKTLQNILITNPQKLLNKGFSVNSESMTLSHYAASRNQLDALQCIAQLSPNNLQARTQDGRLPIHFAAREGCLEALNFLCNNGHNSIDEIDNDSNTVTHFATLKNQVAILRVIFSRFSEQTQKSERVKTSTPLNFINKHGKRPIQIAINNLHKESLRMMLQQIILWNDHEHMNRLDQFVDNDRYKQTSISSMVYFYMAISNLLRLEKEQFLQNFKTAINHHSKQFHIEFDLLLRKQHKNSFFKASNMSSQQLQMITIALISTNQSINQSEFFYNVSQDFLSLANALREQNKITRYQDALILCAVLADHGTYSIASKASHDFFCEKLLDIMIESLAVIKFELQDGTAPSVSQQLETIIYMRDQLANQGFSETNNCEHLFVMKFNALTKTLIAQVKSELNPPTKPTLKPSTLGASITNAITRQNEPDTSTNEANLDDDTQSTHCTTDSSDKTSESTCSEYISGINTRTFSG